MAFHASSKFPLHDGLEQKRHEVEEEERLNASLVLEEDRGKLKDAFEVLEAPFDPRLVLVCFQYLPGSQVAVIGEEGVHTVRFSVVVDGLLVDVIGGPQALPDFPAVPGIRSGSAPMLLEEPFLLFLIHPSPNVVPDTQTTHDLLEPLLNDERGTDTGPRTIQLLLEIRDLLDRPKNVFLSPLLLVPAQKGAEDPCHRPTFSGGNDGPVDLPDIAGSISPSGVWSVPDLLPGRFVGLDPVPELAVFPARSREDGDETPLGVVNSIHVLAGAELRVCDVEEVRRSMEITKGGPGLPVGRGITGVAVVAAEVDRDAPIECRGHAVEELLQVRTLVLGVAVGDPGSASPTDEVALAAGTVLSAEADGGGIIVDLLQGDPEDSNGRGHESGEQVPAVCLEETIEAPTDGVISEGLHLVGLEAEGLGSKPVDDFVLAVDGFTLDQDGPQQHAQPLRHWEAGTGISGGHKGLEKGRDVQSVEEVVDDRKGPETRSFQGKPGRGRHRVAEDADRRHVFQA